MIALKNNCQNKKGCLEDNEGVLSALLGFLLNYIQWVKPECLDTDFGPNQTLATEGYPFCTLKVIQNYNDNNTSTPKCKISRDETSAAVRSAS